MISQCKWCPFWFTFFSFFSWFKLDFFSFHYQSNALNNCISGTMISSGCSSSCSLLLQSMPYWLFSVWLYTIDLLVCLGWLDWKWGYWWRSVSFTYKDVWSLPLESLTLGSRKLILASLNSYVNLILGLKLLNSIKIFETVFTMSPDEKNIVNAPKPYKRLKCFSL